MSLLHARNQRTKQALEALAEGATSIEELVRRIYTDVDPKLHGAAARSLLAHLDQLVEDDKVVSTETSTEGGEAAPAKLYRLL